MQNRKQSSSNDHWMPRTLSIGVEFPMTSIFQTQSARSLTGIAFSTSSSEDANLCSSIPFSPKLHLGFSLLLLLWWGEGSCQRYPQFMTHSVFCLVGKEVRAVVKMGISLETPICRFFNYWSPSSASRWGAKLAHIRQNSYAFRWLGTDKRSSGRHLLRWLCPVGSDTVF